MVSKIRSDDKVFLDRTDKVWRYALALGAIFLSPVFVQLLLGYSARLLGIFLILLGGIILPYLVETRGIASDSARARCLSWIMVTASIIVTGEYYLYFAFWRGYAMPFFVPSVMSYPDYAYLFTPLIDTIVITVGMNYAASRVIRYFRTNLKRKSYRDQIPTLHSCFVGRDSLLVFWPYWVLAAVSMALLFKR
jgi:hypothetical protein